MPGIEWFGTAASVLVAVSLMQKNIKLLRILNCIGAAGFAVYGFILGAWPVFGLNTFITLIDLWYLFDLQFRPDRFSHYFAQPEEDPFCREFLKYYTNDIRAFFPGLPEKLSNETRACLILRNLNPVSMILFIRNSEESITVIADYATPAFRDFRNARYFLAKAVHSGELAAVRELVTDTITDKQRNYYRKIGYKPDQAVKNRFRYRSGLF